MLFLVNLLHKIPIPSKPSGNIEVYGDRKIPGKYLVRRRIMEFAIPDIDVSTGQRSFTEIISGMTKYVEFDVDLLLRCRAKVVLLL